ncbi:MAG: hypothetical protein M1828_007470 [Chrysothrix sp. TS-e1954]|nr:MAG: hypothetical protein M1828_007470 [Chrysothrix sp. TS-e1954]
MAGSSCYFPREGDTLPLHDAWYACPQNPTYTNDDFANCCVNGDTCMESNICHYTHHLTNGSFYYLAGSTNKAFNDATSSSHCNDAYFPDIVYLNDTDKWACCSTSPGERHCDPSDATDDQWDAPATNDLRAITALYTATSSASSTSSATTTSTTSSTSTPTPSPTDSGALGSLSKSQRAGVYVGIVIGALLVLVAIAMLLMRMVRRMRTRGSSPDDRGDFVPLSKWGARSERRDPYEKGSGSEPGNAVSPAAAYAREDSRWAGAGGVYNGAGYAPVGPYVDAGGRGYAEGRGELHGNTAESPRELDGKGYTEEPRSELQGNTGESPKKLG